MMHIPKTYVLTLNKKNKIVFQGTKKIQWGELKTHKKPYFFHLTEISGRLLGRVAENRPDEHFRPCWSPDFVGWNLDQKKKVMPF